MAAQVNAIAPLSAPVPNASGRWLQVISHLDPSRGGMSAVVPRLASEVARLSHVRSAVGVFQDTNDKPLLSNGLDYSVWPASRVDWLRNGGLRRRFEGSLERLDGVHIHGLWETSTDVAARAARKVRKPYIISAHGMLEPWALRNKALKKRIYATFFEKANLQSAACLHALTRAEADDYRNFGIIAPIVIIPNGVDAPPTPGPSLFLSRFPQLRDSRIVLYLGRIHFKKGLDVLIPAWAEMAAACPDTTLVLAGPDSENSLHSVTAMIEKFGLQRRVVCTGMLDDPLKWSALSAASCFILPSYSEGLSVAVLEAMSMGLPVIVSPQCHMPEIAACGAGLVAETSVHAIAQAIKDVLSADTATLSRMSDCGRALVKLRYSWRTVARQMAEVYEWAAGGPAPTTCDIEEVRQ